VRLRSRIVPSAPSRRSRYRGGAKAKCCPVNFNQCALAARKRTHCQMYIGSHSNMKGYEFVVSATGLGLHMVPCRPDLETLHSCNVFALSFRAKTLPTQRLSMVCIDSSRGHYHSLRTSGSSQCFLAAKGVFVLATCASVETVNKSETRVRKALKPFA